MGEVSIFRQTTRSLETAFARISFLKTRRNHISSSNLVERSFEDHDATKLCFSRISERWLPVRKRLVAKYWQSYRKQFINDTNVLAIYINISYRFNITSRLGRILISRRWGCTKTQSVQQNYCRRLVETWHQRRIFCLTAEKSFPSEKKATIRKRVNVPYRNLSFACNCRLSNTRRLCRRWVISATRFQFTANVYFAKKTRCLSRRSFRRLTLQRVMSSIDKEREEKTGATKYLFVVPKDLFVLWNTLERIICTKNRSAFRRFSRNRSSMKIIRFRDLSLLVESLSRLFLWSDLINILFRYKCLWEKVLYIPEEGATGEARQHHEGDSLVTGQSAEDAQCGHRE